MQWSTKVVDTGLVSPQVGVRHGCSFTGFTGSAFSGDTFTVTAGDLDRLVVVLLIILAMVNIFV